MSTRRSLPRSTFTKRSPLRPTPTRRFRPSPTSTPRCPLSPTSTWSQCQPPSPWPPLQSLPTLPPPLTPVGPQAPQLSAPGRSTKSVSQLVPKLNSKNSFLREHIGSAIDQFVIQCNLIF